MSAKAAAKGAAAGVACIAAAAFIALFPAWLMRSKGAHYAPTAAAAVASPSSAFMDGFRAFFGVGKIDARYRAEDNLAYALIELGYACQTRNLTERQCKDVYDRSAAEARR
jgi:hypothetical protein